MDKILHHSVILHCDRERAFKLFTEAKNLESWLTVKAEVEPLSGGKFELFWNPDERENDSTIGCRITGIVQNTYLSFEWKGPKKYKHFMNDTDPLTHVTVFFISITSEEGNEHTEVHLIHSGWRQSPEWEEARLWFKKAWDSAFERLKRIESKPEP